MINSVLKKITAALLCAVMLAAVPLSVSAEAAVSEPLIYVAGLDESTLYENPNRTSSKVVFGLKDSSQGGLINAAVNIMAALILNEAGALGTISSNLNGLFDDIACADDGTSQNTRVSTWQYPLPLSFYEGEEIDTELLGALAEYSGGKVAKDNTFVFTSDWRLDPFVNAAALMSYIDEVLAYTGADKVNLLCGGYGGVTGQTYLYEYESHASRSVGSVTFLNCPLTGDAFIGDLFTNRLYQTAGSADGLTELMDIVDGTSRNAAFMSYFKDDPDGFFTSIFNSIYGEGGFSSLLTMFTKLLITRIVTNESDFGMKYNTFLIKNGDFLYETVVKRYLTNMPGLWALVPEEYFDDAMDSVFGDELVNPELYDKIMSYRSVLTTLDETFFDAKMKGIRLYVVAGYGISNLPLTVSINAEADGSVTTRHASAGGTTEECGIDWEGFDMCVNAYHNHLEPDGKIDASTCALPENTWFIKGLPHLKYANEHCAEFLLWLIFSEKQRTVWDDPRYSQYLTYNKYDHFLTPVTNSGGYLLYGDADVNGRVDVEDAREVLRIAIGVDPLPSKEKCAAIDVDGDYYITVSDARLVLRRAIGLDKSFPVEK